MKQTINTSLAALVLLLAVSCKKESNNIQSSGNSISSTPDEITAINAPGNFASVTIGNQVWMKRNLNVARYRNGDRIPQVKDSVKWAALKTGAWCWYKNDSAAYAATYGKLYNWYAVHDRRGLAPEGWHVPTVTEWKDLINFLGGGLVAGGKMKEKGTTHWLAPNTGATNSSGFTALPGGGRYQSGANDGYPGSCRFVGVGRDGFWWSSEESDAWECSMSSKNGEINGGVFFSDMWYGYSVRCLRD